VHRSGIIDEVVGETLIRDRRALAEDGIVLPIIAISRHTGRVETLPKSLVEDSPPRKARHWLPGGAQDCCPDSGNIHTEEKTDWGVMKDKITADLKRYISKQTARRPLIMPVILEV